MTRLLDWLAYQLIALGKRHRLLLRIEADHADGFAVRYRRGDKPAVSITWTSGTHREQVAFVVSPELAAFIGQGIRESLIEIRAEAAANATRRS